MKKLNLVYSATFLLSPDESMKVNFDIDNVVQSMLFAIDRSITEPIGQLKLEDGRVIIYVPEVSHSTTLAPIGANYHGRSMEWRISIEVVKISYAVNVALVEFLD